MKFIEYFSCPEKEKYLKQIEACDWRAAKFLATNLKENKLQETLGGWAELYLLVDGDTLVSFVTLSAQDCIADPTLTPWLGFLYTAPEYRGNRYSQKLIDKVCSLAESDGYNTVYIATDHVNLYEKYGFDYIENRIDVWGEDSRIYKRKI